MQSRGRWYPFAKRALDLSLGLFLAVATLPLQVGLFLASLAAFRGKPLFVQIRPGLYERPIRVVKFRTMREAFDENGNPLPDELRLTAYGKFLRRASLDELPQLWSVVWGTMSLVGPRPLLVEYLPLYNPRQRMRHLVKPGLTGWAQVHGRNLRDWSERLELDAFYVEHRSLALDFKILILSVGAVVCAKGAWPEGGVPKFTGAPNFEKEQK
ncbi:MAG: sugar transferase [Bacteroidia bacterium]|nr:sugar transferase [Bacteroidia bacterium]